MKCPSCQKENKSASHFCIFCGSPLSEIEAEQPEQTIQELPDSTKQELTALREEVKRLRELITNQSKHFVSLNERLDTLEGEEILERPFVKPAPIIPEVVIPPPQSTPKSWTPPDTRTPEIPKPVSQAPSITKPPTPPPSRAWSEKKREREWEWILGGNWLARIGVLALIIGVAFLLKLAADKDWIGPMGWIAMGIGTGLAMSGIGYYWKRKYPTLAQAITGGGIAILYLSAFAAFALFDLINFYLATGFLLVVSITSATLSLRHNSMALAIIGILGAFSAPFILAGFAEEGATAVTEASRSAWLLVYIIVVDLGVLALSTFRNWRWFTLLALLSSLLAFGAWYSRFGDDASLLTSQGSLTVIFLIFAGATTLYHIVWRRAACEFDYTLMVINAAAYFGLSYMLLRPDLNEWMGGFTFALSLFYGGLSYLALKRGAENIRLSFFALGISLVLFTVAIPIQLGDAAWVTIAWAAEGAVLVWLSFSLRMPLFRLSSYAVFAAMAARLLFFDARISLPDATPFINERFLAFFVCIAATYFAGYLVWRNRNSLVDWEKTNWQIFPIFIVGASLFVTVSIPIELGNAVWTTIAWACEGAILVWFSLVFRIPLFRICSYAVFAAMAARLLFFDTKVDLASFQVVLNERFLAFLIAIIALYFASWREMKALRKSETTWSYYPAFLVSANFLTLWLFSVEIMNYFDSRIVTADGSGAETTNLQNAKNLSLTGLWAFYAVIVLVVGIIKRSRFVRVAALILLAIPIVKVFAYDVIALEQVYRIVAFVGLGILLVTSGYLYQRYSKSIKGFFISK
jgi:uncharacterized membrane protein